MFYWDYDLFYTQRISSTKPENLSNATSSTSPTNCRKVISTSSGSRKRYGYISASTENAQARFLPEWVKSPDSHNADSQRKGKNAIVLCNEALLLPVLHSIPQDVQNVNITMGFPLAQTPVYSFMQLWNYRPTAIDRIRTFHLRSRIKNIKTPLHPATIGFMPPSGTRADKDQPFLSAPVGTEKDDFLTILFTPQSNIRELCDYLSD